MKIIKNIFFLIVLITLFSACDNKVDPIKVEQRTRNIDTEKLAKEKAVLNNGNVAIGVIYGWGKKNEGVLMHTPDLLDIIIVKDGYTDINEQQQKDLTDIQTQKKTKVLVGYDFQQQIDKFNAKLKKAYTKKVAEKEKEWNTSSKKITNREKEEILNKIKSQLAKEMKDHFSEQVKKDSENILSIMDKNKFDGISIAMLDKSMVVLSIEEVKSFLQTIIDKIGKDKILIIENPLKELAEQAQKATWIIDKTKGGEKERLEDFSAFAQAWASMKVFPSINFLDKDLDKGYKDSKKFTPKGKPSKIDDILRWSAKNRGGVAYYHIEKNYFDISGANIYNGLNLSIARLKARK